LPFLKIWEFGSDSKHQTDLTSIGSVKKFQAKHFFLVVALFMGMTVGISAVIGKELGEKNPRKVKQLVLLSLVLALTTSIVVNAIGYFTISMALLYTKDKQRKKLGKQHP